MKGQGLLKGLWITLKHTFEKDITVQYPEQMPYLQDRFRGCLDFEHTKCIVCGLCTKACPNNVLSFESRQDENTKKKKLVSYTIDLQYCMFCNLCVETCPANCLKFTHNFELSQYQRDDIKIVYQIPQEVSSAAPVNEALAEPAEDEAKKQKLLAAMVTALQNNPQKVISKIMETEAQTEILAGLLKADENRLSKMAALIIEDKEKAKKVAVALVNKELKDRQKEGGVDGESK